MSTEVITPQKTVTIKSLFDQDNVKKKFQEMMGQKAQGFMTSVLQIVASSDLLIKADPLSIYNAAAVAATLDLPLNNNLGFAYIVPYNQKQKDGSYKNVAQFQLGNKGFKQLALRSGQFLTLNATDVREGEIITHDRLSGEMQFKWIEDYSERSKKKVVGYVSYFKLINGYSQTFFMTSQELEAHGKKYSQTYKKGFGLWKDDFDSMCLKTVCKLNLSKNAPLSIEMQKAILVDQSVIKNDEGTEVEYADHEEVKTEILIEDLKKLFEEKKDLLGDEDFIAGERIIKNEEKASYKKLQIILNSK